MTIPTVRIKLPAVKPYIVQVRATENWSSTSAHATEQEAREHAEATRAKYPALPVRIAIYDAGV
jgi:hypothetical protein